MIRTDEEFEAALEEVIGLLELQLDPAVEERLAYLLGCIEEYRSRVPDAPAPPIMQERREKLAERLDAFESRWPPEHSLMTDLDATLSPLLGRDAQAGRTN